MKKKLCCILMLIVLLLNSSLMLVVSEAVEAVQTAVEKAQEEDKRQAINELNLTKYENFDTTAVNGQESKSGSKGTLVQFNLKTGLKLAEGVDYVPFKQTSVTMELPWVGDYKPSRVEVITKSTQATNGEKSAKYEYHASTGILTITAENKDYKDNVVDARDEYDIICIYREECYSATNEERDLKVRANVEVTLNDENSTKVLSKVEKEGKITEKIGDIISAEYQTEDIYNGYIEANSFNENNKYETTYKETAKIEISNKDLAQKYMMTWINKFENDEQELDDTSMLTYKETSIDKAKFINTFGEKASLDILNNAGKILKTINKDTETDENGKVTIKYEDNIQNIVIKLTGIEKEGIVEFENTKCISSDMKDLTYNKINTYMIAQGYNTIQTQQENSESKVTENKATEDKKVYQAVEKNTVQIKDAISNIETKLDNKTWANNAVNEVILTTILKTNTSKDSLFKNPTITVELPSEVEEAIITEPYLVYNNLKFEIEEAKVIVNENKNKAIKITLKGSQENYEQNTIAGGVNVVVPLKVYLRKSLETTEKVVKTTYTNENAKGTVYTEQGKTYDELTISLVNKIVVATPVLYSADQNYVQVIEKDGIRVEISRKVGNQSIPEEGTVYEQQIVNNTIKVTNTNTSAKSVKFAIDIPNEMTWVVLNQKDCDYNEKYGYYKRYDIYEYNAQSSKKININLNDIKAGETVENSFDLRINDLEDTEESKVSSVNYQMVIGATQYDFSNKLQIKQAEIKTELSVAVGTGKNDWTYKFVVENISGKDLTDVDLTFEASAFFEISSVDDNYGSFDGNMWRHTISQLAKGEQKKIWIRGNVNEYSEDNDFEYQLKAVATAKASNVYLSNETTSTGYVEGVEVTMSSNKEGQKLRQDDEIEYTVNIKNIGKTRQWYTTYSRVNVKDYIPYELTPVSVSYNNYKVEITKVKDEDEPLITQNVENFTEIQQEQELSLVDKETEDVANIDKELIIPQGKTITLKIKARARMIYENKDATNKVDVSGDYIKTKTASLTNTVIKYDEPENPDPEEPETVKVTGITLDNTKLTLKVGASQKLVATVTPENADNKNIIWESEDYSVVGVDDAGNVTAKAVGTTIVTATTEDEAKVAECEVTVIDDTVDPNPEPEEVTVTGVFISTQSVNLKVNENIQLNATVMPENATNKKVIWKTNDKTIADVDENGIVTAKAVGTTTVTVITEDGGMYASCKVTVTKEEQIDPGTIGVEGITLNAQTLELKIDEIKDLVATVVPENATNKTVIWTSSNPVVAMVNEKGRVTGKSEGVANIMATTEDGGITVSCKVTVTKEAESGDKKVVSVNLDLQAMRLKVGTNRTLQATVLPEDATNKKVTWSSSNSEIATVDQNGNVIAKSAGLATITVTTEDGGKTATCQVTVADNQNPSSDKVAVTDVNLNTNSITVKVNATRILIATIEPTNATNKNVTWSSNNEEVLAVDQNGKITGKKEGKAVITVTTEDGGKTATCEVTVLREDDPSIVNVTGVKLDAKEISLTVGKDRTLQATILPEDATNKSVTWKSNNSQVATVDENGKVVAKSAGKAIITVITEDGGKMANCEVYVIEKQEVKVTGIALDSENISLNVGENRILRATILPENATNKNITWSSNNNQVATVDGNGNVIARGEGTAVITVTTEDGGKTAQCTVTVSKKQDPTIPDNPIPSETITISGVSWIDENEDGKRDDEEKLYSNMDVLLYDYSAQKLVYKDGTAIRATTNEKGEYEFTNITKGEYIVVFLYDSKTYSLTEYQKQGVSSTKNSDAIEKNVLLEGKETIAGLTDTLTAKSTLKNIDIGVIKNKSFDMELQKYISKITVQTKKGTKTYDYNNKKLAKVEINSKYINGATVILEYKMVVTNKGELEGKVGMIVDNIPDGLEFHSELNPNWYEKDGKLYTIALSGEKIGVGESKEVTIVFIKTMNSNNVGKIENVASIDMSSNEKAVEDNNKDNDTSKVEVIIGLTTGVKQAMIVITTGSMIVGLIILVIILAKKNKMFRMFAIVSLIFVIGGTGISIANGMTETSSGTPNAYISKTGNTAYTIYAYNVLHGGYDSATLDYGAKIKGHNTGKTEPFNEGFDPSQAVGNTATTSNGYDFSCVNHGEPFPNIDTDYFIVVEQGNKSYTYSNEPDLTLDRDNPDKNRVEFYNNNNSINTIGPFDPCFKINYDKYINTNYAKLSYGVTIDYMTRDGSMHTGVTVKSDDLVTAQEGIGIETGKYGISKPNSANGSDIAGPFYIRVGKDVVYVTKVRMSLKYETLKDVTVKIGVKVTADINATASHQKMERKTDEGDISITVPTSTVWEGSVEWEGPWRAPTSIVLHKKDPEWVWNSKNKTGIPMNNADFLLLRGKNLNRNDYLMLTDLNGKRIDKLTQDDTADWIIFDKIMKPDGSEPDYSCGSGGVNGDFYNSYDQQNNNNDKFFPHYPREYINCNKYHIYNKNAQALVFANGKYYLANFGATKANATRLATNSECAIAIGNLRWGDYTFVEDKSNRYEYTQVKTTVISGNMNRAWAETHFDVENKRQTGNLRIYKRDTDQNRPLQKVEFLLKAKEGSSSVERYVILQIERVSSDSSYEAHDINSIKGLKDQRGETITKLQETTGTWAKRVKGTVKVSDIAYTTDKNKATILTTNKSGIVELDNLLVSSKGYQDSVEVITYKLYELYSNNYGYAQYYKDDGSGVMKVNGQRRDVVEIKVERQKTTATAYEPWKNSDYKYTSVTITNDKLTQNLHIFKKDYDQHNKLLPGVTFRIVAKVDGNTKGSKEINNKYIRIKASGNNVEKGSDGYANKITGSARIDDRVYDPKGITEDISASERQIKFTSDASQATLFVTDSAGKIEIQNLLVSLNGKDRIQYHLEEIENPNYGWVAEKPEGNSSGNYNNYTVTFDAKDGGTMTSKDKTGYVKLERGKSVETDKTSAGSGAELNVYNKKQTTSIKIDKTDYDNHNTKLGNVVFVLKAKRNTDIAHPENPYKYIPVGDTTKYVQIKTSAGWQEGTTITGFARAIDIKYVDYDKATRFATDSSGKIEINNILMSTNGADKILYHIEELKNPNYGWVAEEPIEQAENNRINYYNNYTVMFDATTGGTVTNNTDTAFEKILQRGWVDANRASSKETDKTSYGSTAGITVGVRNVKQTTNILIEKTDTDNPTGANNKLDGVKFILKAQKDQEISHSKNEYKDISGKYVKVKVNGSWQKEVKGSIRIEDIEYVSNQDDATRFVTQNGKLEIHNLLISTNGSDKIWYHLEEIDNPNYGWVAEKGNYNNYTVTFAATDAIYGTVTNNDSTDISSEDGIKARGWAKANRVSSKESDKTSGGSGLHITIFNLKQTTNILIKKTDKDNTNFGLNNVEFVLKAKRQQDISHKENRYKNIDNKYVRIKTSAGWQTKVQGRVRITDIEYVSNIKQATRFVTGKVDNTDGVLEIYNLLISTNGADKIEYHLEEVANPNYGWVAESPVGNSKGNYNNYTVTFEATNSDNGTVTNNNITSDLNTVAKRGWAQANRVSSKETDKTSGGSGLNISIRNWKQTTNILIDKIDNEQSNVKLANVAFVLKAKRNKDITHPESKYKNIDNKYVRIKTSEDGDWETKVTGSIRIVDIDYVSDISQATQFLTDANGRLEIHNILISTNGDDRIYYHLEELSNPNYGYVAESPVGNSHGNYNNYMVTFSSKDSYTENAFGTGDGTVTNTQISDNLSDRENRGWVKANRQASTQTDLAKGGSGVDVSVRNWKQTTNILIDKVDNEQNGIKLANVTFVLSAKRNKDLSAPDNKYRNSLPVDGENKKVYVRIKVSENGDWMSEVSGSIRIADIDYVSDIKQATKFVTDNNGRLEIHNILMSTNGADRIYYHLEEIENPNYGYVAESPVGNSKGNYNNYTVTFKTSDKYTSETALGSGDGTVTNNEITADLKRNLNRGWIKSNRQTSTETDKAKGGSGVDLSVLNWKQTTNIFVEKTDTDQNNVKLSNVTFVLKAKRNKDVTHPDSKYKNIDDKYVRIKTSTNGNWVTEAKGTVRVVEIDYVSDFNQATKFVTDDNGKLAIKNILMSTNGDDRIYYHLEEISNPHYGWVAEKPVGNPNGNYNNYTVTFDTNDKYDSESGLGKGDGTVTNNNSTDINSENGVKARGWVKANRQASTQTEANGTAGVDVSVRNLKETANILIDKTDSLLTNKKLANVEFVLKAKKDKEISHPENKYKDINEKYVRIKTSENGKWEKEVRGSVRIVDIDYVTDMKDATKFITDDNGRLEIHNILISTNGADKIWYHLEEISNPYYGWVAEKGNYNNYTVHFSTKDNESGDGTVTDNDSTDINSENGVKARGWTKPNRQKSQETDKKTGGSGLDVNVLNVKQTSNLFIEKVDSRNTDKKLPNVSFILKAQRDKDISHAENRYKNIDNKYVRIKTSENGNWEKEVKGTVYIKDIDYVSNVNDATTFITGENGRLEIYNLLMSTNGADIIKYHLEEVKNENYGYLSDNDKYKNFRVDYGNNAPDGWVTLTRMPSTETEDTSSKKGYDVEIKNEQMYIRASGYVWEDIADAKSNTGDSIYKEESDALVKGIRVYLHKTDGNNDSIIAKALTDENGYYEFGTKIVNGKKYINGVEQPGTFDNGYENKDYWGSKEPSVNGNNFTSKAENENGNLVIQDLGKYYIEFEYDGLKFTTVATKWDYTNRDDESSKAEEVPTKGSIAEGSTKTRDRETVNKDFAEIWQNSSTGYNTLYNNGLSYTVDKENHIATYNDKWAYKYENNSNGKKILNITDAALNKNHEYAVLSTTKQSEYNIAQRWKSAYENTGLECITNNNQGIFRREQADNAISEDIDSVDVIVNGYKNTYQYGGRKEYQKEGDVEETSDGFGVAVKFGNKNNASQYSNRGLNTYKRPLYESDLAWHLKDKDNNLMEVYVTYKIVVKNQSDTLSSRITEIVNYYDKRYDSYQIVEGSENVQSIQQLPAHSGVQSKADENYNAAYIELKTNTNTILEPGSSIAVMVRFHLSQEALTSIAHQRATLMNVSEISAFSSYYGKDTMVAGAKTAEKANDGVNDPGKIYAAIDKDSAPLDAEVGAKVSDSTKLDAIKRPDGSTLNNYYEQNLELTDKSTFEDDTDFAPSLILGIDETDPTRAISGIVWEDASNPTLLTENQRLGNGIYDDGEKLVKDAEIKLLQNANKELGNPNVKNENIAKAYKLNITGNTATYEEYNAIASSKEVTTNPIRTGYDNQDKYKYNWIIVGIIPGENYKLRYGYGTFEDGKVSTIDGEEVDAREYKSTIVCYSPMIDELQKATGGNTKDEPIKNWIADHSGNIEKNEERSNVAIDADLKLRAESDDIYYGSYERKIKMIADTAIFDVKVENNSMIKVDQVANPKNTSSTYEDEFEFILIEENGKKSVKRKPTFYSVIPFMDFGITLRPKQKLDVDKTISKLTITLANGQNLIFGDPYKDNLNYVKALGTSGKNRLVLAEIDNELIQGATVEVEYAITITNYSEIDYDYISYKDYYYWGNPSNNEEDLLQNVVNSVVDYMRGGLQYDEEKNSDKWKQRSLDYLLGKEDENGNKIDNGRCLINDDVKGGIKTLQENNDLVIVECKGKDIGAIKPPHDGKPGESTTINLYGSKLLAVNTKGVVFKNNAEILGSFKKITDKDKETGEQATPGNHNPNTDKEDECDDGRIRLIITPPTGLSAKELRELDAKEKIENNGINKIFEPLTILKRGYCLIKKQILEK